MRKLGNYLVNLYICLIFETGTVSAASGGFNGGFNQQQLQQQLQQRLRPTAAAAHTSTFISGGLLEPSIQAGSIEAQSCACQERYFGWGNPLSDEPS